VELLLNILWAIFGGFLLAIQYWLGGLVLCLTVVGIPFGLQALKLGTFALLPFGKKLIDEPPPGSVGETVRLLLNVLWLLVFGLPIALTHLTAAAACAVTIIGIPFAWQHLKMVVLALLPFGKSWVKV
jgi:uncharacterized membrane protein YccF (DUF307 family)